jgi:uncharacterized membrane protein
MAPIDPTGMMIGSVPMESYYVTREVERIPEDELAVSTGTKVMSSDEKEIGHVAELVGDRGTREVTHFVVEHGNKEVTLPLTAITFVAENTVNLKLDKASMEKLPWIEARPKHGAWAGANMELVGAVFDDTNGAQQTLEFIRDLHHRDVLKVKHAAVLVKDADGKITIDEQGDLEAGGGAKAGAVVGGVVGLLTGGIGLLAAPLAGAAIGAVGAKVVDRGFSNTFLKSLAERLQPGKSGLLVVVQDDWVVSVRESLAGRSGVILQHELTDRLVAELTGEATPPS